MLDWRMRWAALFAAGWHHAPCFAKHRLRILGPCRVRTGVGVGLLQLLGEPLELVGEQVPVAVQRRRHSDAGALGDTQTDLTAGRSD